MTRKPTIVVCLFDQKSNTSKATDNAKLAGMKRVPYTASDIVRYCARLNLLPGPYTPPMDVPSYITRGGEVGAVAFRNFVTDDLAGMTRELEHDALMASTSLSRPWIHGCISIDVTPKDYDGEPDDLLEAGHALMKMFGVDENRYMLAVHLDSGQIHVHFLYSRVDTEGNLREGDRKMPKFMAEEATALLARQFDFSLAPHHLSRVTPNGILDLASDRLVRGLDFGEFFDGMKSRNAARKKTKRNELLTLALVARHEAHDLLEFRTLLARHGITYEKNGSGAEFLDTEDRCINASDVDHKRRFTPTNMFNGALLSDFPETPEALQREADRVRADAKLAQDISTYANLAENKDADANLASCAYDNANMARDNDTGANMASSSSLADKVDRSSREPIDSYNDRREIDRFFADRRAGQANATDEQVRWDKSAVAALKSRPGRPSKTPVLPGWPDSIRFDGFLGSPAGRTAHVKFSNRYEMLERAWQTEIWRESKLVASIRYSRISIVSTKEDDLREALRAAHGAWGRVEIFGKPKFKQKMAKLAAEMNIPISNPELQEGIARLKKARTPAIDTLAGEFFTREQIASNSNVATASSNLAPALVSRVAGGSMLDAPIAQAAQTTSATRSAPTADQLKATKPNEASDVELPPAGGFDVGLELAHGDASNRGDASVAASLNRERPNEVVEQAQLINPTVEVIKLNPYPANSETVMQPLDASDSSVPPKTIASAADVAGVEAVPEMPTMPTLSSAPTSSSIPALERPSQITPTNPLPERPKDDLGSRAIGRDIVNSINQGNWPIRRDPHQQSRLTLYENELVAFRIHPDDLGGTKIQAQLKSIFEQQQSDLCRLRDAVCDGIISVVTQSEWKGEESVSLQLPPNSPLVEVYRRCSIHPQFDALMKEAHRQFVVAEKAANRLRAAAAADKARAAVAKVAAEAANASSLSGDGACQNFAAIQPCAPLNLSPVSPSGRRGSPAMEEAGQPKPAAMHGGNDYANVQQLGSLIEQAIARRSSELNPSEINHNRPSTQTALYRLLEHRKLELGPEKWPHVRDTYRRYSRSEPSAERDRLAYVINASLNVRLADRCAYPELTKLFAAADRNLEVMKGSSAQKTLG